MTFHKILWDVTNHSENIKSVLSVCTCYHDMFHNISWDVTNYSENIKSVSSMCTGYHDMS